MKISQLIPRCGAYTLVEALVASSILMIGVGAAASLSMTMAAQEEINHEVSRALAYHDAAIRLFQLGLDPVTAADILPDEPSVTQLSYVANADSAITDVGNVRHKTISVEMLSGGVERTHSVEVYRSTIDGDDIAGDEVRDFTPGGFSGEFTSP